MDFLAEHESIAAQVPQCDLTAGFTPEQSCAIRSKGEAFDPRSLITGLLLEARCGCSEPLDRPASADLEDRDFRTWRIGTRGGDQPAVG